MAAATSATPDLSVLYDRKKYRVITTPTEDEPNVLRCSRNRVLGFYVNTLKELLKEHETVIIMGAGKAVPTAEAVADIALNVEANLHKLMTKGVEKHSFTFESKDDAKTQVTNEREVEYIRIQIKKNVTDEEKSQEGYQAGPTEVSEESLTQAIRKARSEVDFPRGPFRRRGPAGEGEEGARRPRRRVRRGNDKGEDGESPTDGEKKPRRRARRGPKKTADGAAEGAAEGAAPAEKKEEATA